MEFIIFVLISYVAAGIVFITREADLQIIEIHQITPGLQHPILRFTAGLIMMMLWPAFLLTELFEVQPPMAVRIENFKH